MPLTEVLLSTGDATLKKRASVLTEKLRNLAGNHASLADMRRG